MSETNRANKLAAARKKLKEYQTKDKTGLKENDIPQSDQMGALSIKPQDLVEPAVVATSVDDKDILHSLDSGLNMELLPGDSTVLTTEVKITNAFTDNMEVIQMLISEKGSISNELSKYKTTCRELELENEELNSQHKMTCQRLEHMERDILQQREENEMLKSTLKNIKYEQAQTNTFTAEQSDYVQELKKELLIEKSKYQDLESKRKQVCNELEMNQIRIDQLSDEANITADNRVETLTQAKFMYEQQIRDLQAMVQQYNSDKEQASQQYQNYVQHLNNQISLLSEKNSELTEACLKFEEREKNSVEHIGGLEKQIQQSLLRQEKIAVEHHKSLDEEHFNSTQIFKAKIDNLERESTKMQSQIDFQLSDIEAMKVIISEKEAALLQLEERLVMQTIDRPDNDKLLAAMESDKIAASRAISQNLELKQQLDELQLKFVQLTNDKVELINRLDSEEHANKEIRVNYSTTDDKLHQLNEKLHYKDEEMIRLSHENNELKLNNLELKQQIKLSNDTKLYKNEYIEQATTIAAESHNLTKIAFESESRTDKCEEDANVDENTCIFEENISEALPDTEAVQKLQTRFSKLIREVADLTDEKQRLEHLVLQLQSETETIGEYISLYQTQRRILKQREYERNAQLQRLLNDREYMKNKMLTLNKLVSSLGIQIPSHYDLNERDIAIESGVESTTLDEFNNSHVISSMEINGSSNPPNDIIKEIQNIITEMKESSKQMPNVTSVDHCSCCSGKFETV